MMAIEESKNIQKRIFTYCTSHPDITGSGIIKGMDHNGKVVLQKNGIEKRVSIDVLEKNLFDFDSFDEKKDEGLNNQNNISNLEEEPTEEFIERLDENVIDKVPTNLKEFSDCITTKNESLINKALETFAIDSTGKINMEKAIEIVKENSIDNVLTCVRDGKNLSTSLTDYDITGKHINMVQNNNSFNIKELIDLSFNNVLLYFEAAKLKNISFTDEKIANYKAQYTAQINDKINILGLNRKIGKNNNTTDLEQTKQEEGTKLQLKPDKNIKRAGFADIIILTIIVLVYAVIIINLITKIK